LSCGDREERLGLVIEDLSGSGGLVVSDLRGGKSSDEDELSIPRGLEDLSWRKLRDVELFVRVSDVSDSCNHLMVDDSHKSLDSDCEEGEDESLHHVNLSSSDLIVLVLLIPDSIFIKPIINFSFHIKMLSEIAWSRRGKPEFWFFIGEDVSNHLLVLSIIVFLHNSERSGSSGS
jgi:hypothetical protein